MEYTHLLISKDKAGFKARPFSPYLNHSHLANWQEKNNISDPVIEYMVQEWENGGKEKREEFKSFANENFWPVKIDSLPFVSEVEIGQVIDRNCFLEIEDAGSNGKIWLKVK